MFFFKKSAFIKQASHTFEETFKNEKPWVIFFEKQPFQKIFFNIIKYSHGQVS